MDLYTEAVEYSVATPQGSQRILGPVSLRFSVSRTAIIGGNGSGKSTFLPILAWILQPSAGRLVLDPPQARRGFVFANPEAQLIMPVVAEDLDLSLRRVIPQKERRRAAVEQALSDYQLQPLAQRSIYDLSSGEKQRVALAGVLAAQPELILADEPTTVLDLRTSRILKRALLAAPAQLIYATHDLEFAAAADEVIIFHDGGLHFQGSPGQAITRYRKLAGEA